MSGLFVGGTDTGCGKTTVGVALVRAARARGQRVGVLKPVETGCTPRNGELIPEDAVALARAAGDPAPLEQVCPYRLALPAAPSVAAAAEGVTIDVEAIAASYAALAAACDRVLVEGAGGLRVPLCEGFDMLDLARRLRLPLLLVARARLGTINHTLLALEAAERRGVPTIGVVVSHTEPALSVAERANLDWLLAHCPAPVLAELPFQGGDAQTTGSSGAAGLDLDRVWKRATPA